MLLGILISVLYLTGLANLRPYGDVGDAVLQQVSSTQILMTLLAGLAILAKDNANADGVEVSSPSLPPRPAPLLVLPSP